ncbi:hypothetical protein ABFB10_06065 [Ponticoccus litoralis]|uniref:Uncharacterized protein n=1 Tax=Ponticoccus litoralis TaxID=422297 RepID=A0AAW9SP24_9RHOB
MLGQVQRQAAKVRQEIDHQVDGIDARRARDMPQLTLGRGLQPQDRLFYDDDIQRAGLAAEEGADFRLEAGFHQMVRAKAVGAFPSREGQDHVARKRLGAPVDPVGGGDEGRDRRFHVRGAAPAQAIIDNIAGEGRELPVLLAHGGGVEMGGQHQGRLGPGSAHPTDHIGTARQELVKLVLDPEGRKLACHRLRHRKLATRRVAAGDADQLCGESDGVEQIGMNHVSPFLSTSGFGVATASVPQT